ncbi:3'-5' exonuclease [Lyngbya sp. PCC 8106]|uniref:3'-5' exonuclease n=1 Tax=Lyngbya sp. (strain PCC 8106) TaxID=313612 RepID=UPI0000EAC9CB|nr:3'-5' exonuclease [Lyngbya sp. PCC 8106]EAW37955.1 Exonuclease [Lyngbya sp. PCC 8106]
MNIQHYNYCLIIDLEATCCDQHTILRSEMEIIEIGAVMVETKKLTSVNEFQTFIKPIRHPILTKFCQQLTSITQAQVEQAPHYPEAIKNLKNWLSQYSDSHLIWGSWGDYDRRQFDQDSQFHHVSFPIGYPHINLKKMFSTSQGLKGRYGMADALKLANIPLEGTHHRGIDDTRNIAKLMPYILGVKKLEH